jgi:hypothetical protein
MDVTPASDMEQVPLVLWHGTDCQNIASICQRGLSPGTPETCNPYTKNTSMGQSFVSDCVGNVSMAVDMKDAVFFVVANASDRKSFLKPQCLIRVDSYKLDQSKLFFRELFGKRNKEAKYFGVVPPEAFSGYLERSFTEEGKKVSVKETWKMCPLEKVD